MKTVFWKCLVSLCEHVQNNPMDSELGCGLDNHFSREPKQQTTDTYDNETGALRKTTTIEGKHKRLVVKLAPLFYKKCFSGDKQGRQG